MKLTDNEMNLANFFIEREGDGILDTIRDIDFVDSGIIDSLDMVSLAVFIEKHFNVKLDLTDPENLKDMRRFDSLMAKIGEKP
jgi:acyl carrier protein